MNWKLLNPVKILKSHHTAEFDLSPHVRALLFPCVMPTCATGTPTLVLVQSKVQFWLLHQKRRIVLHKKETLLFIVRGLHRRNRSCVAQWRLWCNHHIRLTRKIMDEWWKQRRNNRSWWQYDGIRTWSYLASLSFCYFNWVMRPNAARGLVLLLVSCLLLLVCCFYC